MFENWLDWVDKASKEQIWTCICALMWPTWNCRNDIVFNKSTNAHYLQVSLWVTHWMHEWSYLLLVAQRAHIDSGCSRLETVTRDIYNQGGWRFSKKIQDA
jgi:hypothetical protein